MFTDKVEAKRIHNKWGRIGFERLISNLVNIKYTCMKIGTISLEAGRPKRIEINVDDVASRFNVYNITHNFDRNKKCR